MQVSGTFETRLRAGARSRPRHVQCTWGACRRARAESCRLPPQGHVGRCYWRDATAQVATPPTASEFCQCGGIIGITLRPVHAAEFSCPITDEHLLQSAPGIQFRGVPVSLPWWRFPGTVTRQWCTHWKQGLLFRPNWDEIKVSIVILFSIVESIYSIVYCRTWRLKSHSNRN